MDSNDAALIQELVSAGFTSESASRAVEADDLSLLVDPDSRDGKQPYGNVTYADPGYQKDKVKRYPINTAKHVKAAWSYINQKKNAAKYTPSQVSAIKGRIKSAAKKFGIKIGSDNMNSRPDMTGRVFVRAFDFQTESVEDGRTLRGYAAVFDNPTMISDYSGDFREVIRPGAFARSLAERTPVLQFEHGRDPRVGAVPIGAIRSIHEDSRGLFVEARLFDNPVVEPVREAIAEKAIQGMSFRFGVPDGGDKWTRDEDGVELREIYDTDTRECGPVVFPAYDQTSVSVRSLVAQLDEEERRALIKELADYMNSTGQFSARSASGGDSGTVPQQVVSRSIRDREFRMRTLKPLVEVIGYPIKEE